MIHSADIKRAAVEQALEEYYLLAPIPEHIALVESLPRHPSWQAPLWIPCRGDRDQLVRRIETAGSMWLGCSDITPHNLLVITCPENSFYFLFQRCQGRGGNRVMIGPIEEVLTGGSAVGPNGTFCQEIIAPLPPDTFEQT